MKTRAVLPSFLALAPWLVGFSPLTWLDPAAGSNRAGNDHYEAGRFEDAAKSYSQGVAADPDRPELLYNLGNSLERLGKHEEASAAYHQALEKAPEPLAPDAWYNLGNSLLAAGQAKAAVQAYREALRRNPRHDGAKRNLELALDQAKKEPPKPNQGKNGKDDQKDKSSGDQQKSDQQDSRTAENESQQPKPSDSTQDGRRPEQPEDHGQPKDQDQPGSQPKPDEQTGEREPPRPEKDGGAEAAGSPQDDRDLTRDQAEGLLRSFEQMERRQLQEAHPSKDAGLGIGGRDW
ncbi:MAG: tetratricopeptide repeat protein [Deltaproteobacteria bacterium]|nr:tetratricopeptide repeat protein [Deltaproteobacteria bacterium]